MDKGQLTEMVSLNGYTSYLKVLCFMTNIEQFSTLVAKKTLVGKKYF